MGIRARPGERLRSRRRPWRGLGLLAVGLQLSGCGLLLGLPELETKQGDVSAGGQGGQLNPQGSGGQLASSGAEPLGGLGGLGGNSGTGTGGLVEPFCAQPCDCDDDGWDAKGECGGDDCDDDDPVVHPGQLGFFLVRAQHDQVGFDYDCSGSLERDPEQGGENVLHCDALSLDKCTSSEQGFAALPECGLEGDWSGCQLVQPLGLGCEPYVADSSARARCH